MGWIGTGVMGNEMARHLLEDGYKVSVHNRTKSKADSLISQGAEWISDPINLAKQSDFVFMMLGYPHDVE